MTDKSALTSLDDLHGGFGMAKNGRAMSQQKTSVKNRAQSKTEHV
jgi:hypothetical protein